MKTGTGRLYERPIELEKLRAENKKLTERVDKLRIGIVKAADELAPAHPDMRDACQIIMDTLKADDELKGEK